MWVRARAFAFGGVGAVVEAVLMVRGASRERACGASAGGGARALRGRSPLTFVMWFLFFYRRRSTRDGSVYDQFIFLSAAALGCRRRRDTLGCEGWGPYRKGRLSRPVRPSYSRPCILCDFVTLILVGTHRVVLNGLVWCWYDVWVCADTKGLVCALYLDQTLALYLDQMLEVGDCPRHVLVAGSTCTLPTFQFSGKPVTCKIP